MDLEHFRILIHELLDKDPDIVPEEAPLIILYINYDMCMAKNGNYNKHTRHISRTVNFVRYVENRQIHKIDWWEGGLQLADTANNNVDENDLNPGMKYITVRIYIRDITLVQEG